MDCANLPCVSERYQFTKTKFARPISKFRSPLISVPFYLSVSGAASAAAGTTATSPPNEKDESPPSSALLRPKDSSGKAAAAAAAGIPAQATTAAQARAVGGGGAHGAKKKPSKESEPVGNACQGENSYHNNNEEELDERSVEERHKLAPDGDDFKLVFISSDSSKESGKWSDRPSLTDECSFAFFSVQLPFLARV